MDAGRKEVDRASCAAAKAGRHRAARRNCWTRFRHSRPRWQITSSWPTCSRRRIGYRTRSEFSRRPRGHRRRRPHGPRSAWKTRSLRGYISRSRSPSAARNRRRPRKRRVGRADGSPGEPGRDGNLRGPLGPRSGQPAAALRAGTALQAGRQVQGSDPGVSGGRDDARHRAQVQLHLGESFQHIRQFKLALASYEAAIEACERCSWTRKSWPFTGPGSWPPNSKTCDRAEKYLTRLAAIDFGYRDVADRLDKLAAVTR